MAKENLVEKIRKGLGKAFWNTIFASLVVGGTFGAYAIGSGLNGTAPYYEFATKKQLPVYQATSGLATATFAGISVFSGYMLYLLNKKKKKA